MKASLSLPTAASERAYATEAERHAAVAARDAGADGHFVYAVKTTGVYCRPSCPARPAHRENLRFHESCEAAERAGFRPCKRCQPNGPAIEDEHRERIAQACRTLDASADAAPDLDTLARAAGMSRFHFHRVFKKVTGLTPKAYAKAGRGERMRKELPRRGSVTEAIYEAGYQSNGRFYAESSEMLGMMPKHYRQGGAGETIRFAVGECFLGQILVASSEKGVCSIMMGNDAESLVQELESRFPKAELVGGDRGYEATIARVVGFVEAPGTGLDLPLDIRGTAFQRRVWEALREIPAGKTLSYAELAERMGAPRAVRAVAGACAANKIAVAIPCHRVVRTGGKISGYRWGVERKRALLDRERSAAPGDGNAES